MNYLKIWCEECKDFRLKIEKGKDCLWIDTATPCPACNGKGYTENKAFFDDCSFNPKHKDFWKLFPEAVAVAKNSNGFVYIWRNIPELRQEHGLWYCSFRDKIKIHATIEGPWEESLILRKDVVGE